MRESITLVENVVADGGADLEGPFAGVIVAGYIPLIRWAEDAMSFDKFRASLSD